MLFRQNVKLLRIITLVYVGYKGSVVVVMVGTVPRGGTDLLVTGTAVGVPVDCGGSDPAALQGALDLQGRV